MPSDPPSKGTRTLVQILALAMELPVIPVAAVLIGGGLGYLLDKWLHTGPFLTLTFGVLGFAAGIRELVRRLKINHDDQ
ncbi:MAG: AtpZ/AtpI family protein [Acidobacteria bacterium]|nr:AtpZ/AtpI family protein [Acidobacteriota bacterium]MCL5286802.1 AtpZ/AtpI family protein [Acidobacteriota bacterium]